MKRFAITGVGGFVAPRHLEAIKAVGGEVTAALDPYDAVGILDLYNPGCAFFTETERFDRYLWRQREDVVPIDYLSICSPNHLHDAHMRMGLRNGCEIICEKPLVLNPDNLDALGALSKRHNRKVNTILQLRSHPEVEALIEMGHIGRAKVSIRYITPRGRWYYHSWKGDPEKSGGVWTNIGVHLFDLLHHVFGATQELYVDQATQSMVTGRLKLEHADVQWMLSLSRNCAAERTLEIDGRKLELSKGFTDAHTKEYRRILDGRGWGLTDAEAAIRTCWRIGRLLGA